MSADEWGGHYCDIADFLRRMGPYEPPCLDVGGYNGTFACLFPKPYLILDAHCGPAQDGSMGIQGWVVDGHLTGLNPELRFNTVITTEAMEHFDNPIVAFQEMAARLNPRGKFVATSPSAWGYHPSPGDFWRLQKDAWYYLAIKANLEVLAFEEKKIGDTAITGFFAGRKR